MASPSYNDIRSALQDALAADDKDKGEDLVIVDIGSDWVVYRDPDTTGGGLVRRGYRMDGKKAVLTSDPVKVTRQTTYEPSGKDTPPEDQPKNLSDAADKARQEFAKKRESAKAT